MMEHLQTMIEPQETHKRAQSQAI
jgi:hypothetical protein